MVDRQFGLQLDDPPLHRTQVGLLGGVQLGFEPLSIPSCFCRV
jgi:hypothetical protein